MKYFLKPLGYCLTTAVMTSAMLRLYALPAVEAATADSDHSSSPATLDPANQTADQASQLYSPQAISAPEFLPPESLPAESNPAPANTAVNAAEPDLSRAQPEPDPGFTNAKPTDSKSDTAPNAQPASPPTDHATDHASDRASGTVNGADHTVDQSDSTNSEASSSSTQPHKSESTPVRTLAGMRQIVEQRLAAIVDQDKRTRETQWQQSLIYTTLQYAWTGQFDEARQVAQHPALSADLQAELLDKITMIQQERLSPQIAGQPKLTPAQQANLSTASGRSIPSGYALAGLSGASYSAVSLGQQCPITPVPSSGGKKGGQADGKKAAGEKAASGQAAKPAKLAKLAGADGIPALVPALNQNLASRLFQLSQLPSQAAPSVTRPPAAIAASKSIQPRSIQPPEMFVGVASRLQPVLSAPITSALPQVPAATVPAAKVPAAARTATTVDTKLRPVSQPVASVELNQQVRPEPPQVMSAQAERQHNDQSAAQFAAMMPIWDLDQLLNTALDPLEQFGFSLPDWISAPLTSNWSFWNSPRSEQTGLNSAQLNPATLNPASPAVAQVASERSALPSLEQSLAAPKFGRDMRKLPSLALPGIPTKTTATPTAAAKLPATAKPVLYDAAALLAMSCAQESLTHYSGDQVIDPASAKRMGWVNLMFPLPVAAVLTSAFGWRVHPISGSLSFHTGLDLGAPMGTPVLAATAGRVVVADEMGGYGLAVVIEAGNQRNLYGHLSGIAVQPGTQVAQGTVLGWVGSTGNSTGPHLHFESQVSTSSGWTTVNPIASATLASASQ